jgi:hypothetical protein
VAFDLREQPLQAVVPTRVRLHRVRVADDRDVRNLLQPGRTAALWDDVDPTAPVSELTQQYLWVDMVPFGSFT